MSGSRITRFGWTETQAALRVRAQRSASFLRWRLIPVRYVTMLPHLRWSNLRRVYKPEGAQARAVESIGLIQAKSVEASLLSNLQDVFLPRCDDVVGPTSRSPFVNLSRAEDFTVDNPLMRLAFSPQILDVALDYYSGHCRLDKVQVLYSFPSDLSSLRESQKWHRDFNDSRSFHAITYLNDVLDDHGGPFVCVSKEDSRRIRRSPILRRIDDDEFMHELGNGELRVCYGKAGSCFLVDPSASYHYGSRCRDPRLAVFVTFRSDRPFVPSPAITRNNARQLLEVAQQLRPDLPASVLAQLLDV